MRIKPVLINIQFLRAIAALMVVLFHLVPHIYNSGQLFSNTLSFFRQFTYAGVDVFFVISGYVIWTSTQKETSIPNFIYKRLTRIYLGFWPYFFIFLGLVFIFNPQRLEGIDLLGSFLLQPIILPKLLLQVAWTLSYELYFYLCFTFLMLLPRKQLPYFIILLLMLIMIIQSYHIFVNDVYSPEKLVFMDFWLYFLASPFCIEFLAGCLIGVYFNNRRIKHLSITLISALIIFLLALWYQKTYIPNGLLSQGYYTPERVMLFGTIAALLVASMVELNLRGTIIFKRISSLLGGASYSIYLAHIPIIFLLSNVGFYHYMNQSHRLAEVAFIISLAFIIVYSSLHYLWIEKPLMTTSKKFLSYLKNINK